MNATMSQVKWSFALVIVENIAQCFRSLQNDTNYVEQVFSVLVQAGTTLNWNESYIFFKTLEYFG